MTGDDLRALSAAATPGPWEHGVDGVAAWMIRAGDQWAGAFVLEPDAELIVWLRNHADALADFIDAAKDLLAEWDADDHNNMVGGLPHAERCQECDEHWPCPTARWADAFAALGQETPT